MALRWDPATFSYVDDATPATGLDRGMTGAQGVLAGNIVPQLGAAQQYGLAMRILLLVMQIIHGQGRLYQEHSNLARTIFNGI